MRIQERKANNGLQMFKAEKWLIRLVNDAEILPAGWIGEAATWWADEGKEQGTAVDF